MNLNGLHREPTTYERPIYGSSRLGIMNKAVKSPKSAVCSLSSFPFSRTDYYPFGYPIASRSYNSGYRYGFNGQEKDNEVYGDGKSYTAEFWQYDSRLGRRWNVDPKPNISLSPYSCFANNPIVYCDLKGDTIINGLANILDKSVENLIQKQVIYNNLINNHIGKLKKSDIRKYRRESGLKDAESTYNNLSSKKRTVDRMIYTYSIVNPEDYIYLNSLQTNIIINMKEGVSESGEYNFMSIYIPAISERIIESTTNEVTKYWIGNFDGDIIISIWDGAIYPYNTCYLANEFGDVLYFYSNVIPNDPTSFQKWQTTGNSKYTGYWSDPSGAGQQSFKHQYEFKDKFNSIKYRYPERKVDTYNYIIKP